MRKLFGIMAFALSSAVIICADYNPFADGAKADVRIKVVDDYGVPVKDATVSVVFMTDIQKADVVKGLSDADGCFCAEGKSIGEMRLWLRKDGYYDTKTMPTEFMKHSLEEAEKTHRWSADTVDLPVVLKKKRNPVKLVRRGGIYSDIKYPTHSGVMSFDLEKFDWCPPYGNGRYADILVTKKFWRSDEDWLKVYDKIVITMTNCLDGAYFADTDPSSSMKYPYAANTNAVFNKEFTFEYDRRSGEVKKNIAMPKGKCLVFRTRTTADEEGRLKTAHYGIITETFDPFSDMDMEVIFNPTVNDSNLEDIGLGKKGSEDMAK